MERLPEGEKGAFYSWKYKHYFKFVETKGKNIVVQCVLCAGDKRFSTAKSSTSNLSKHLKGQHSHSAVRLVEKAGSVPDTDSDSSFPATKQLRLDFSSQLVSGENLKKLVAAYIVEEMLPISTVDSPSFRGLIDKIPTRNNARLPQRKTFSNYLDKEYATMEANLRAALQAVNFVSTTADIWTSHNKSYMGVTIHLFNPCTLQRNKAALACKRIRGRHTYDVIASELEQIHSSSGVLNKVVATVTDNGSNFVKAFKTYQHVSDIGRGSVTHGRFPIRQIGLDRRRRSEYRYRCISIENTNTRAVYRVSIAKCTALWTKASRSTVASEHVEDVSQRKLLVPSSTRWNSFFEAVSKNQFLMEYCTAMKPLTAALDILQGDNCSYGALIPTLEVLMTKTLSTKDTLSRMTAGLPDVIVKAIQTRFADVLENKDALLAAVSCPQYKLRWVGDDRRQQLKELLIAECGTVPPVDGNTVTVPTHWVKPGGGMDFYEFGPDTDESYTAEQEVMDYLRCGGYELHTLNQSPNIKNVFLKYNTPTPSSAPVEHFFSLGGIVLTPRRNRLSEVQVMLVVLEGLSLFIVTLQKQCKRVVFI
uniref:BED-type domain-containing protein n=1 Tax=Paramormyrops kingsleyae TaxID=1676925 RepID=A0A3B3SK52_9TELE